MAFLRRTLGEYVLVALTLLVGLSTSFMLAWMQESAHQNRVRSEFTAIARDRVEVVSDLLANSASLGRLVSSLFRASENVSAKEFNIFTAQMLKDNPHIRAIEWVPLLTGEAERSAFEQRMSQQITDFTITAQGTDEMFVPMPRNLKSEYFPVEYVAPLAGNSALLGFDISSSATRLHTLETARETNSSSLSGKIDILQDLERKPAVSIITPVHSAQTAMQQEHPVSFEKLEGFVVVLMPLSQMIEQSLRPLNPAGVHLLIYDLGAQGGRETPMFIRSSRLVPTPEETIIASATAQHSLQYNSTLNIANRQWDIRIIPAEGHYKLNVGNNVWISLAGGALFTALLVFYMIQRIREREKIARTVVERTQQLQKAKHETDLILRSTHEGIIGIDMEGKITFCNPMAYSLLGYTKREMIGQPLQAQLHHSMPEGIPYPEESCPILKAMQEGVSLNASDQVFWKKDGTALAVEFTAAPIMDDGDIEGGVVIFRDVTERRLHEQELQRMARFDQLTGLANRSLFFELLRKAVQRTVRGQHRIAVIYMDLNGFKPVNDTLGHAAGDRILQLFGERISGALREYDTLARVGGDEFTVLADNLAGRKECEVLIERLRAALEAPFEIEGQRFAIGASMGVALYPHDSKDMDTLISYADKAMYHAKENKHLPYVFYEDLPEAAEES